MFTLTFWKQAGERAIKSAAQALLGLWVGAQAFNAWDVDWKKAAGVALGGAILSLLTSLASAGVGKSNSPSLVDTNGKKHAAPEPEPKPEPDLVKS
jgi:Putative lactococcus lactis phage r1t holin